MTEEVEFRGATITHLIGTPAVAIAKANHMMAAEQVKLLMKICFSKKEDDVYEPVMIRMSIRRATIETGDDDDSGAIRHLTTHFEVPLITLLPLNSLAIESMDFKFDMDVHTHHEVDEKHDPGLLSADAPPPQVYELAGSICHELGDETGSTGVGRSRAAPMSISVSTLKHPLPLGVTTIVQAYSKAIQPVDDSSKDTAEPKTTDDVSEDTALTKDTVSTKMDEPVDINTATADELEPLIGIGPVLAQRIIEHREAKGPFANIEAIVDVSGIGKAIFEQIKDSICVK